MTTDPRPLVVVAIGGNALLHRGEAPDISTQRANVAHAARSIADLARTHRVVVTHGNGPQVGLLARQSEALAGSEPVPLDVLDAESAGLIGYLLATEVGHHLGAERVVVVLTRVVVDGDDRAFDAPSKPIGAVYDEPRARSLADRHGWTIALDGTSWRRVVASPDPVRIVELVAISALVAAGTVVVCGGGGGIPVLEGDDHRLRGVEAVIDKDRTSALLAERLDADELLVLTDVDAVIDGWGTDHAVPLDRATPEALRARSWPAGSMGPKVDAACRFVERTGRPARIGSLTAAAEVISGRAGTLVARAGWTPGRPEPLAGRQAR